MSTITFTWPEEDENYVSSTTSDEEGFRRDRKAYLQESDATRDILTNYVQPNTNLSLDDAIHQVARSWSERRSNYGNAVLTVPTLVAEQIPYNHPSHKKLAEFMLAFHDSAIWISKDASEETRRAARSTMWNEFLSLLMDVDWRPETDHPDDVDEDPYRFTNLSAFVANLICPGSSSTVFLYAMAKTAMEDATKLDSTYRVQVRDARVIAAAQYIEYQVQTIFDEVIESCRSEAQVRKADVTEAARTAADEASRSCLSRLTRRKQKPSGSRRMNTQVNKKRWDEGFTWDEWQTWKQMFRSAGVNEAHSDNCREIARKAAESMAEREKMADSYLAGL